MTLASGVCLLCFVHLQSAECWQREGGPCRHGDESRYVIQCWNWAHCTCRPRWLQHRQCWSSSTNVD